MRFQTATDEHTKLMETWRDIATELVQFEFHTMGADIQNIPTSYYTDMTSNLQTQVAVQTQTATDSLAFHSDMTVDQSQFCVYSLMQLTANNILASNKAMNAAMAGRIEDGMDADLALILLFEETNLPDPPQIDDLFYQDATLHGLTQTQAEFALGFMRYYLAP